MSKEQCKLPAPILHRLTAISGAALSTTPPQKTDCYYLLLPELKKPVQFFKWEKFPP